MQIYIRRCVYKSKEPVWTLLLADALDSTNTLYGAMHFHDLVAALPRLRRMRAPSIPHYAYTIAIRAPNLNPFVVLFFFHSAILKYIYVMRPSRAKGCCSLTSVGIL